MRNAREKLCNPGGRKCSDAASRLTRYVLADKLADTALADLTEEALRRWKGRLGPHLKASSHVRTVSDFKAALNLAHKRLRKSLSPDFGESVRFGLARDEATQYGSHNAREDQILPDETVRDIVDAAAAFDEDGDVGRMVLVLAATGARFSQVQRIRVGDVQSDRLRIFVPTSRKGRGKTEGHYPVQIGEDVIDRLRPAMASRKKDEPLLWRWRLVQVKASEWRKGRRGPWTSASEMTRQWKTICKSLDLGSDVVPYALRHSSIVRGIRNGLPIRLVAAMLDTSVAMIERHYVRYIVDGLEDLAAKAVVTLARPNACATA
jgi:integrase